VPKSTRRSLRAHNWYQRCDSQPSPVQNGAVKVRHCVCVLPLFLRTIWLLLIEGLAMWQRVARRSPERGHQSGSARPGPSIVSDVTAMSICDHWLIQQRSNFKIDKDNHFLKQPWRGRVVGELGSTGVSGAVTLLQCVSSTLPVPVPPMFGKPACCKKPLRPLAAMP
jgi:hypothetical protein